MSITIDKNENDNLQLTFDNGDLKALNEVIEKWNFKDTESVLKFAIAVLMSTTNGTLCRQSEDGSTPALRPKENLLKE